MKRVGKRLISTFLAFVLLISNATIIHVEESQYEHYDMATEGGVTLKVEWNDPVLGQETTFHVSATGGVDLISLRWIHQVIQIRMYYRMKA